VSWSWCCGQQNNVFHLGRTLSPSQQAMVCCMNLRASTLFREEPADTSTNLSLNAVLLQQIRTLIYVLYVLSADGAYTLNGFLHCSLQLYVLVQY